MKYTLIGSPRSPFVRICRMLMLQNRIGFDFRALDFVNDKNDANVLEKETPINKVPVLVVGEQKIFDSRVIMNFLMREHQLRTLSLEEENIISVIYGCLDSGVILFLLKRDGYDLNSDGFFLKRNQQRIPDALNYLLPWVKTLNASVTEHWYYPAMSLYSFLYWANAREILKINEIPQEYRNFLENFKSAPGVQETSF